MSLRPMVKIVKGVLSSDGDGVFLGAGDRVMVEAITEARVLLLAGRPIAEPVFWHGPFVMNSRDEIVQAFEDFQSGAF